MSIEVEAQRAEKSGVTVAKERLIAILKASGHKQFAVCRSRQYDFIIIKVPRIG